MPYLFVGSGLSRRYSGLPDWATLLKEFAVRAGLNFDRQYSKVNGDLPKVASNIAEVFHDVWWDEPEYRMQREMYPRPSDASHILKIAVSSYIRENQQSFPITADLESEIEVLRKAVLNGVITTNYDNLVEQIFPDLDPYVGQDELLLGDAQFVGELYKIHGSIDVPETIVLTAQDYENVEEKNKYLAAKLLTIFAEHPVVFVGYSINDPYIEEILNDIVKAVGSDRLIELGERIYFVKWNSDPNFTPTIKPTQIERGGHLLPITEIETFNFSWIWDALSRLERTFSAKVLRELKKKVYDLVYHPEPGDELESVKAISIDSNEAKEAKLVFGVARLTDEQLDFLNGYGMQTLSREDIDRDILGLASRDLPAEMVLMTGIRDQVKAQKSWYIGVWKYLKETGRANSDGDTNFDGLDPLIEELAERDEPSDPPTVMNRIGREISESVSAAEILARTNPLYYKMASIRYYMSTTHRGDEVRQALVGWIRDGNESQMVETDFRKVVFALDRELYRPR